MVDCKSALRFSAFWSKKNLLESLFQSLERLSVIYFLFYKQREIAMLLWVSRLFSMLILIEGSIIN